mgnify:CR=1 FL=1
MADDDASESEQIIYNTFIEKRESVINELYNQLS